MMMLPRCTTSTMQLSRLAICRQRGQLLAPIASTLVPTKRFAHDGPSTSSKKRTGGNNKDLWDKKRVNGFVGHSFPDFLEFWNRDTFRSLGYGMAGMTGLVGLGGAAFMDLAFVVPATAVLGTLTAGYWAVGLADISQKSHVRIVWFLCYPRCFVCVFVVANIHPPLQSNTSGDST